VFGTDDTSMQNTVEPNAHHTGLAPCEARQQQQLRRPARHANDAACSDSMPSSYQILQCWQTMPIFSVRAQLAQALPPVNIQSNCHMSLTVTE
jgi:hypothetical protein